ncbi:mechanosensitive ion channel family protein [Stutzerimonas azotifigens]|uniref:mechanosensitive ion channel family protein n=1 Tax=Stutzerimonas azotifigens TaxID=291995 RepID=UPI0003F7750A|nr:mechanosensitive ion channel family protein [Stutzerimonas azotifigens]
MNEELSWNWGTLLEQEFWIDAAVVLGVTIVCYLVLRTVLRVVANRLGKLAGNARGSHARILGFATEMLRRTSRVLVFAFSLLLGLKAAELPDRWAEMLSHGWFIALAFQIALWLDGGVRLWMESLTFDGKARNPVTTTIIGIMLRVVIWTMMLLSILANLGVDITAMVASLGVGGIAIALAVQTLLSDVFASLSIGVDKPFEIGDFVVFGDVAGSIEHIGLKTTRIRALSGEQIVCSNADMLSQFLHNYKRMEQRRIVFKFGVTYDTPAEKVRQIGGVVAEIIKGIELTRFDRAHFLAFDDYQLTFEVVYYVLTSDYNQYMDIQQEINLSLLQRMKEMEVSFSLPAQRTEFVGGQFPEVQVAGLPGGRAAANGEGGQPRPA